MGRTLLAMWCRRLVLGLPNGRLGPCVEGHNSEDRSALFRSASGQDAVEDAQGDAAPKDRQDNQGYRRAILGAELEDRFKKGVVDL
jgi:hypothetical protein